MTEILTGLLHETTGLKPQGVVLDPKKPFLLTNRVLTLRPICSQDHLSDLRHVPPSQGDDLAIQKPC